MNNIVKTKPIHFSMVVFLIGIFFIIMFKLVCLEIDNVRKHEYRMKQLDVSIPVAQKQSQKKWW